MKKYKITFSVNKTSIEIGSSEMDIFSANIPDIEDHADLFHALVRYPSEATRVNIAEKRYLNAETAELLLRDSSPIVVSTVLRRDIGQSCLTKDLLLEYIEIGNPVILGVIILELDEIVNEFEVCPMEWIVDMLVQISEVSIKTLLAEIDFIPKCYLEILAADQDISVRRTARRTLEELE